MLLLRVLIFTVLVPGFVSVGVPYLLLSSGLERLSLEFGSFRLLGGLPIAAGAMCYAWCAWEFAASGRGTPAPIDPPKTLVAKGLYRIVRNPMYLGVELILLGEAMVFESVTLAVYAGLLWLLFHLFVIYYEEPNLKKKFGASYEAYCRAVPRWIPKIRQSERSH